MSRLVQAVDQIVQARKYTLWLLENIDPKDWFRPAPANLTHIAWQVGHLAMAEYRLALDRMRGIKPEDAQIISAAFLKQFGKDSVPDMTPAKYPGVEEIKTVLNRVHQQTLHEMKTLPEQELDAPPLKPHPLFTTKLGSLFWCARHEMLHAGQIGLLRRLLGYKPIW